MWFNWASRSNIYKILYIGKTVEATGDLFGNKIADVIAKSHNDDKITKNTSQNTSSKSKTIMQIENADEISREIYITTKKYKKLLMKLD